MSLIFRRYYTEATEEEDTMGHAGTRMVETVYARTRHEGIMKQLEAVEAINSVL